MTLHTVPSGSGHPFGRARRQEAGKETGSWQGNRKPVGKGVFICMARRGSISWPRLLPSQGRRSMGISMALLRRRACSALRNYLKIQLPKPHPTQRLRSHLCGSVTKGAVFYHAKRGNGTCCGTLRSLSSSLALIVAKALLRNESISN